MADALLVQRQLLAGSAATLTATFYDAEGTAADPGSTTVAIADEAGAIIVASGAAGGSLTTRTVAVTGSHTAQLNRWVVTWTTANFGALTTRLEVVGSFLFSIPETRTYGDKALASATKYPASVIEAKRADLTDQFTSILGYSPIRRYEQAVLDGAGSRTLLLPALYVSALRAVESRASGGTVWAPFDSPTLADVLLADVGALVRDALGSWTSGRDNWRVSYEHGRWAQIPGDLRTAALMAARFELVDNALSDRAISMTNEFGSTQIWQPGMGGHVHAIPYVDEILQRYCQQMAGIA